MTNLIDPAETPDDELWHRLAFHATGNIGPARLRRLRRYFGTLRNAWRASETELVEAIGIDAAASVVASRDDVAVDALRARASKCGARLLLAGHAGYPPLLAEIGSPPDLLWVRGSEVALRAPAVAIVGTRRASDYGRRVTWELAEALVAEGVTVVSGLARGIDTIAHEATLEAGGTTVGVLGCGIDVCYPAGNGMLLERMVAEGGAIVSEFRPGAPPLAGNFPARNRIVSGLSLAVVVVEAGERSGATITAKLAADQGRDVFAVPGPIDSASSVGANLLLAQGAGVVTRPADLLTALDLNRAVARGEARASYPMDDVERAILEAIVEGGGAPTTDEVARATGLSAAEVGRGLAMLELKGLAAHQGGARWRRVE